MRYSIVITFVFAFILNVGAAPSTYAASLERLIMPGPVSNAHADIEDECSACHSPVDKEPQFKLCVVCHEAVGEDLGSKTGFHGLHPSVATDECQSCHAEHEGRDAVTLEFDWQVFDHTTTNFPLLWSHAGLECDSCHAEGELHRSAPTECAGCHQKDDPHEGKLGDVCSDCHTQRDWQEDLFDHSQTDFALTGKHQPLACASCHENNSFTNTPTQCVACHQKDDTHKGLLGSQCDQCHTTTSWPTSFFDHSAKTPFSLTGAHDNLNCTTCHNSSPITKLNGSTCVSCHAKDDIHDGNNGTACASCHTTVDWSSTTFDHASMSGFALNGAHNSLACASCHTGSLSDPLPRECHECHAPDPHANQLGSQCADCHSETAWRSDVRFDHDLAAFPLLGKHETLQCNDCHATSKFRDSPGQCIDCHAKQDIHSGSLGNDCGSCHNPKEWQTTRFDHGTAADFPLTGVHAEITCDACHAKPVFLNAKSPDNCSVCHRQDDPHEERFGTNCGQCHGSDSFAEVERL